MYERKALLANMLRHFLTTALMVGLLAAVAGAQESPCFNPVASSVVSRPTVASATDPTQCGVAELEYGLERQWPGGGAHRSDFSGGLRFGLLPNLDFHWYATDFLSLVDASGKRTGYGDNWFGLKWRLLKQGKRRPSFGFLYEAKAPTGDLELGYSGKVDQQFAFLVSKDVFPRLHWDFNVIPERIGRPDGTGADTNVGFAWASWITTTKRLTLILEPYGFNTLNSACPGFASVMAGGSFQAHRQLYFDAGVDVGVSHFAPRKRVFVGVTYAIGNVYYWLRPQSH
jgi:Putative MetA-pathway of phenol degradation